MAACEAAALQFHFDVSPAVPVVGQPAEASLSWHVADPANAPVISATMKGPEQITCGPFADPAGQAQAVHDRKPGHCWPSD